MRSTLPPLPDEERRAGALTLTFLGTSSGQPTLTRNLSCVALKREGDLLLLDCGEGAQIQFRRAGLRFGRLRALLITHLHGDHVTGICGILMSLQMTGRTRPLLLAGPPGLREYVLETSRMIRTGYGFELRFVEADAPGRVLETEDYHVETHPLEHRIPAMGYRFVEKDAPGRFDVEAARRLGVAEGLDFGRLQRGETVAGAGGAAVRPEQVLGPARPGRVVAYCTDTRPCEGGVRLGRGADVLIHESTFLAERADDARETGHSTAGEAAEVAHEAGASRLIITHFSPRYADSTPLLAEARAIFPATEAAEELREYPV